MNPLSKNKHINRIDLLNAQIMYLKDLPSSITDTIKGTVRDCWK